MRDYEFSMALSAAKLEAIYRGNARYILVESLEGLKLQLPAINFRGFVGRDGIHGRFRVRIDDDNRILALDRV